MEVTVEGVSEALDILCEHPGEVLSLLNDTNSPLPSSVPGVVLRKTKETRTTGIDLKGKQTRVNDEPDGSTSQSPLSLKEQQNLIVAVAIHGRNPIMPRTKRARPERGESSNPVHHQPQQQHHDNLNNDFLSYHYEQAYSHFINRPIITGRN
ncbi:unnamed protein product [Camellia sinensis]